MVVTNHEFTPAARKLAELHGCELVGRRGTPAPAHDDPAADGARRCDGGLLAQRVAHGVDRGVDLLA